MEKTGRGREGGRWVDMQRGDGNNTVRPKVPLEWRKKTNATMSKGMKMPWLLSLAKRRKGTHYIPFECSCWE